MTCATPLSRDRTARVVDLICPTGEAKYFCKWGWTANSLICPSGKSAGSLHDERRVRFLPLSPCGRGCRSEAKAGEGFFPRMQTPHPARTPYAPPSPTGGEGEKAHLPARWGQRLHDFGKQRQRQQFTRPLPPGRRSHCEAQQNRWVWSGAHPRRLPGLFAWYRRRRRP